MRNDNKKNFNKNSTQSHVERSHDFQYESVVEYFFFFLIVDLKSD